jgi:hypothetical protein
MVVDLGLAQGDTLSCILFKLYANDLIAAFEEACAGVELPLAPPPCCASARSCSLMTLLA